MLLLHEYERTSGSTLTHLYCTVVHSAVTEQISRATEGDNRLNVFNAEFTAEDDPARGRRIMSQKSEQLKI